MRLKDPLVIQQLKKNLTKEKVIVGPSESMSKSKKNTIDPETNDSKNMVQTQ